MLSVVVSLFLPESDPGDPGGIQPGLPGIARLSACDHFPMPVSVPMLLGILSGEVVISLAVIAWTGYTLERLAASALIRIDGR